MPADMKCLRCRHAERSHLHGVCRTCARTEQRHPYFNFSPAHRFYSPADPDDVVEAKTIYEEAMERAMRGMTALFNEDDSPTAS